jgi:hypothetical protein
MIGRAGWGELMAEERRRSPRVAVDVPARVTSDAGTVEGRICDICRDAAFVTTDREWAVGTRLSVETELPRVSGLVRFAGPVVRVGASEDGHKGAAILFEDIDAQAALRIELFVNDPGA